MSHEIGIPTDRASFEEDLEAYLAEFSRLREEEIAQQAKGGDCWWLFFDLFSGDLSAVHGPSAYEETSSRRVAAMAVIAESEDEAKAWVVSRIGGPSAGVHWISVLNHGPKWNPAPQFMEANAVWPGQHLTPTSVVADRIRREKLIEFDRFGYGRLEFYQQSTYELVKGAVSGGYDLQEDADIEELTVRILTSLALGGRISPDDIPTKN